MKMPGSMSFLAAMAILFFMLLAVFQEERAVSQEDRKVAPRYQVGSVGDLPIVLITDDSNHTLYIYSFDQWNTGRDWRLSGSIDLSQAGNKKLDWRPHRAEE